MRPLILLIGPIGFFAVAFPAGAESNNFIHEVKAGVLAHDVSGLWSGTNLEHGTTLNGEIVFAPALEILWGVIRPNLGASVTTSGATSYGYAGAVYQITGPAGTFFGVGIGGAVHDGHLKPDAVDRKALGSRVLFHIPLEAGIELAEHARVSLYFEHVSNGYLATPNPGMDNLGLRVGYRF